MLSLKAKYVLHSGRPIISDPDQLLFTWFTDWQSTGNLGDIYDHLGIIQPDVKARLLTTGPNSLP